MVKEYNRMLKEYKIKKFKHTKQEIEDIKQALILRKQTPQEIDNTILYLPKLGWGIYTKSGKFICAGFLRKIECSKKLSLFDSFVSNPDIPYELRNEAMDCLVETMINKAKSLEIKAILALTVHQSILMRSNKFRFQRLPHAVISLPIE